MGVLYDYFAASSDEVAAVVVELPGGPAAGADGSFDTVSGNGVDPVVQLGTLESLLTGRDYDDIVHGHVVSFARTDRGCWSAVTAVCFW